MSLTKLALKRDPTVPIGQPAPMHLDCPCGQSLPVPRVPFAGVQVIQCQCGARYSAEGWVLERAK